MRVNLGLLGRWLFAFVLLAISGAISSQTLAQTDQNSTVSSTASQPSFQLKVQSNLVVVHVVVRGEDRKPIENLRKEDFRVFDRGKEQSISQFEVETTTLPSSTSTAPGAAGQTTPAASIPGNFLALYFDDLNTSDVDMIYARNAADRFLAANLQTKDRVAIFTSGQMLSDLTADPQQIHAALARLQSSALSTARAHNCPDLTDYQALEITQQNPESSPAWQMALEEAAKRCKLVAVNPESDISSLQGDSPAAQQAEAQAPGSRADSQLVDMIRMTARKIVFQVETQARSNFQQLDQVVKYISQMPGRRTVVLVSPGFLSQSEQYELGRTIDRAVRSQVVISSLDPRGLAPPRESDASRGYIAGRPGEAERLDSERELVAAGVLAQVAEETGGTYFRNDNDLKAGFGVLAGSPVYYMLAFAPTGMKQDGKFHNLKVELAENRKGFSIQARRGYYAPKKGAEAEAEAEAEAKKQAASDSEIETQKLIHEAVFSKADTRQLPVQLNGKLSEGQDGTRDLSLVTHLDATPLHFQKEGKENLNTLTFAFAVFDEKENLIATQQKNARVNVPDAQLKDLLKEGLNMSVDFRLKPGTYRIREVVMDSEEHHLTALSTTIKVP
jgi:VWFA-related protein